MQRCVLDVVNDGKAAAAASLNAQLAFSKELQAGIASSDWQSLPVCHIQVKQVSQEDSARAAISEIQQDMPLSKEI